MKAALLCACTLLVMWTVQAYPSGPPLGSCTHMYPVGHKTDAQTSNPPYELSLSSTTVVAGQPITLNLSTTGNPTYPYYEGMFVQARLASCEHDRPIGTFSVPMDDTFLKVLNCQDLTASAVSQKRHSHETNKTFTWTAPSTYPGRIYFRATVVKNTQTFWTNVFSPYVAEASDNSSVPNEYCSVRSTVGAASSIAALSSLLLLATITSFVLS